MSHARDVRRLAMQVLYQADLRGEADWPVIGSGLLTWEDGPDDLPHRQEALTLAQRAWEDHAQADALVAELAPEWPTHRQPPVDRAILRLAYHEIVTQRTPVKVAINEAVELAKAYGGKQSPAFINGVLDKMARKLQALNPPGEPDSAAPADPWAER